MRVAQRVLDLRQREVGPEVIIHDHPAAQGVGHRAARLAHAIVRQRRGGDAVQPSRPAADAEPRLVQMPHRRRGQPRRDLRHNGRPCFGFPFAPGRDAGRAQQRGAKQIVHDLADAVLGDQVLRVEIDRRRPDARAVLHMRRHLVRERRAGHTMAARAGVDPRLVLGHLQPGLRHLEHCRASTRVAMAAVRPAWQCPHRVASWRSILSGPAAGRSVSPRCPGWPPLVWPETPRRLPAMRGVLDGPSLEGGLLLLELFLSNRRRRSATSCLRAAFSARSPAISRRSSSIRARTSGDKTIQTLTHGDPTSCNPNRENTKNTQPV